MTQKELIRASYPATLTLGDICEILHISKRKAAWMLQNKYILCKNSGKKTRQYQIPIDSLFAYIDRVEANDPSVFIPTGLFSTKPRTDAERKRLTVPRYYFQQPPDDFTDWLNDQWCDVPEMLTTPDVATVSGYNVKVVQRWIQKGRLKSVITANHSRITTKAWLVEFYCTEAYKIQNKGASHIELLIRYYSHQ